MRPSFEVRSRPIVISSKPTSNIVDGIDRDAKHKTKLIEPNMTRTDRSPAFAFPKSIIEYYSILWSRGRNRRLNTGTLPLIDLILAKKTYPNNDLKGEST